MHTISFELCMLGFWNVIYGFLMEKKLTCIFSSPEPKAHWWAYKIGPSSVCPSSVRRPHFFKHLLLRNHWANWSQISYEVSMGWENEKVCSNGPGHMTKMAAMPIYGKNLKKSSSSEPKGQWPWNLVCSIGCSSTTKFIQMMTLGWPWHILQQGQIWALMLLYGKKVKQWIFQKLLLSMNRN